MADGVVVAVSRDDRHRFSKIVEAELVIIAGSGVVGDAHRGSTVQHRSRAAIDPGQPNLRQVHLIHRELFAELALKGFDIAPGELGENVTTAGVDLLALPRDTRLRIGPDVVLQVTGLRNPCKQIERHRAGLLAAVLDRGPTGEIVRKAGIMSIVVAGGTISADDPILIDLPPPPHIRLERV